MFLGQIFCRHVLSQKSFIIFLLISGNITDMPFPLSRNIFSYSNFLPLPTPFNQINRRVIVITKKIGLAGVFFKNSFVQGKLFDLNHTLNIKSDLACHLTTWYPLSPEVIFISYASSSTLHSCQSVSQSMGRVSD